MRRTQDDLDARLDAIAEGLEASRADNETGAVIGLTLLNVRHTLAKDGSLTLTLPPEHLAADTLQPVLAA